MFDLFREFVRDELNDSLGDGERQDFLNQLLGDVTSIRNVGLVDAIQALRTIQESMPKEFSADPVSSHLSDLIHELERLK